MSPRYPTVRTFDDVNNVFDIDGLSCWYVFQRDFGEQVFATVPVHLLPKWVNRQRLGKALHLCHRITWGESDWRNSCCVRLMVDFGEEIMQRDAFYSPFNAERAKRMRDEGWPYGAELAHVIFHGTSTPITGLEGWKAVGEVDGGVGGGVLLEDDLWIHDEILCRGLETVNELRWLLSLSKLEELELRISESRRQHHELVSAYHDSVLVP